MLLNHVTGCTSYQEIRTLSDGTVCDTFKEAARRRGLLEDDQESDDCLTAAAISEVPAQLRQLFVTILSFNEPSDPLALWNKHKVPLSEDCLFKARVLAPNLELNEYLANKALRDIQYRLEQQGKSLSDFLGMPLPSLAKNPYDQPSIIRYEMDYNVTEQLTIAEEISGGLTLINMTYLNA